MGGGTSVPESEAARLGISGHILNTSIHSHHLHLINGGSNSCNTCGRGSDYFYRCGQCDWDLCMHCYSKICETQKHLTDEDEMRCHQIFSDPAKRRQIIEALSQNMPDMSEDDRRVADICLELLKADHINGKKITKAITTVLADEVKDEIKQNVIAELGLEHLDPTGITSAFKLIRSFAKGDVNGVAKGVAGLVVGKMLFVAVGCTVS
jgi:hypothetical protein